MDKIIKVAVTGGIGSGKSFITDLFQLRNHVRTLKLDNIAHEVYEEPEIRQWLLKKYNTTDRKQIGKIVFKDKELLQELTVKLGTRTRELMLEYISDFEYFNTKRPEERKTKMVVVECAILFEHGLDKLFDKTIVVDAPVELKIERVQRRDKRSVEEIKQIMDKQMDPIELKKKSDYVILNNDASIKFLRAEVETIYNLIIDDYENTDDQS